MSKPCAGAWLLFLTRVLGGQDSVLLFPDESTCACIRTLHETSSLQSRELPQGDSIWQVFFLKSEGTEAFRVRIGVRELGEDVKLWNYGIVIEQDLNADNVSDYSWYGGDDTGDFRLLILSSTSGYRVVDIHTSAARSYAIATKQPEPDLGEVGGDLRAKVVRLRPGRNSTIDLLIESGDPRQPSVPLHIDGAGFRDAESR